MLWRTLLQAYDNRRVSDHDDDNGDDDDDDDDDDDGSDGGSGCDVDAPAFLQAPGLHARVPSI
eukprot:1150725-Pelagomonas_calceolata.AAC.1